MHIIAVHGGIFSTVKTECFESSFTFSLKLLSVSVFKFRVLICSATVR